MSEQPNVAELIAALVDFRERYGCDSLAASYVSPAGKLVTVTIYHSLATITDEDGHLQALALDGVIE